MYGGGTKPESYCKIGVYVQHNAPSLYDNINDLCMFGAFSMRGRNGVTLLLPDKAGLKEIDTLVGKDSRKAMEKIQACILPVFISSLADFKKDSDIPNKLGNKLPIEDVSGSAITLKGGAIIKTDSKFKRLHADGQYAVFKIENGLPPTTGEKSSQQGNKKGAGRRGVRGGNDSTLVGANLYSSDHAWLNTVKHLKSRAVSLTETSSATDVCSLTTLSFMVYLEEKHPELFSLLSAIFPISPLTFLHIGYLVEDSDRKEWAGTSRSYNKIEKMDHILRAGVLDKETAVPLKQGKIRDFSGPTAGSQSLAISNSIIGALADTHVGAMKKYWGSTEACATWYLATWEYIEKLTPVYLDALASGNPKEIGKVFDVHIRFVAGCGPVKKYSDMLLLTRPRDDVPMQIFCAIITMIMGDFGTSGGVITDGISGGSDEYDNLVKNAPNSIKPHSFTARVINHWSKCFAE